MNTLMRWLCLLALLAAGPLAAQESALEQILKRGELRVGLEAGYMPFEMRDKSGDIIGFDVDLAKLMARQMGVKLTLVNTQWDGIIPALLTDKFDLLMGGMTITAERNLQVNFCDPYVLIGQTVLMPKKHAATIKSYRDLNTPSYTVATKLGTTGDIAARKYIPRARIKAYRIRSRRRHRSAQRPRRRLRLRPAVQRGLRGAESGEPDPPARAVHAGGAGLGGAQGRPRLPELAEQFSGADPARRHLRRALQEMVRKHRLAAKTHGNERRRWLWHGVYVVVLMAVGYGDLRGQRARRLHLALGANPAVHGEHGGR